MQKRSWNNAVFVFVVIVMTACAQNKSSVRPDNMEASVPLSPTPTFLMTPTATATSVVKGVTTKTERKTPSALSGIIASKPLATMSVFNENEREESEKEIPGAIPTEVEILENKTFFSQNSFVGDTIWTPTPIAAIGYIKNQHAGDLPQKKHGFLWALFLVGLAIISFGFVIMRNRKQYMDEEKKPADKYKENKQVQIEVTENAMKEKISILLDEEKHISEEESVKGFAIIEKNDFDDVDRKIMDEKKTDKTDPEDNTEKASDMPVLTKVRISSSLLVPKVKKAKKIIKKHVIKKEKDVVKKSKKAQKSKSVSESADRAAKNSVTKKVTKKIVRRITKKASVTNIIPFERKKKA